MGDVENGQGSATETSVCVSDCRVAEHVQARGQSRIWQPVYSVQHVANAVPNDDLPANFTTYVLAFDHVNCLGSVSDHSSET